MNAETTPRARGTTVERELEIAAPVEDVWRALTDAGELARWFPLEARVTPGAGGSIWMSWREAYEAESRIEIWEPNRHLRTVFPNVVAMPLATDYYLDGAGGSTKLRVVTSGFGPGEDWDDLFDGVRCGWAFELTGLQHYLERHRGRDRLVAQAVRPYEAGRVAAWERVVGPDGWLGAEGVPSAVPGDRYALTTATGRHLTGVVSVCEAPRQWVGTVAELNDALLRIEMKGGDHEGHAQLWLAAYDVDPKALAEIEVEWNAFLERALAA